MQNQETPRTPKEILQAALKKELQARDFYAELGVACKVDFVRDLLQKLQNEESKHVALIQSMLVRIAAGSSVS